MNEEEFREIRDRIRLDRMRGPTLYGANQDRADLADEVDRLRKEIAIRDGLIHDLELDNHESHKWVRAQERRRIIEALKAAPIPPEFAMTHAVYEAPPLTPEQIEELREAVERLHRGPQQIQVLERGVAYCPSIPNAIQIVESMGDFDPDGEGG